MLSAAPTKLAALGIVIIQASIALSSIGKASRFAALLLGFSLILIAALKGSQSLSRSITAQALVITIVAALAFEAMSALNGHLIFEPKLVLFRIICYSLLVSGFLIGTASCDESSLTPHGTTTTVIAVVLAFAAPLTWFSLQEILVSDAARGSFDESSPVALGFSSGTLAVASLVVALRSPRKTDCFIGAIAFCAWVAIALQSGSRGALIAFIMVSLYIVAVLGLKAGMRLVVLFAVAMAVFLGFFFNDGNIASQVTFVLERFESIIRFEEDPSLAGGVYSRAYFIEQNLNLPGLGLFAAEGFDPEVYPHNFAVEAFVRLGSLIGLFLVIGVVYSLWQLRHLFHEKTSDSFLLIIAAMGLFTFANAQTNMLWEFLRPLWLAVGIGQGIKFASARTAHLPDSH